MTAGTATVRRGARFARAGSLLRARELGIVVAIAVVFIAATIANPAFAHVDSVQQLLIGASLIALMGVGETLVILTRNYDLSVGSVLGLCAYVIGLTFGPIRGCPPSSGSRSASGSARPSGR